MPGLQILKNALLAKSEEFKEIVKIGRTHLQVWIIRHKIYIWEKQDWLWDELQQLNHYFLTFKFYLTSGKFTFMFSYNHIISCMVPCICSVMVKVLASSVVDY